MKKPPAHAPQCYGSAVYLDLDRPVCQRCLYQDACIDATTEAHKLAEYKREWMRKKRASQVKERKLHKGQRLFLERHSGSCILKRNHARTHRKLAPSHAKMIRALSARAKGIAKTIMQSENRLAGSRRELMRGRNPFATRGPKYLIITCDLLIDGGFERKELREELTRRMEWSKSCAETYTTNIIMAMLELKIIYKSKRDGKYRISRTGLKLEKEE